MTEQRTHHNGVLVPLLAGLAGAGIALLLAPRAGRETREKMHESANDIKKQAHETILTAKSELSSELEHARQLKHKLGEVIKTNGRRAKKETSEWQESAERERPSVLTNWDQEV